LESHFSRGVAGPVTVLIHNPRIDFRAEGNQALLKSLTDRLQARHAALGLTDIRGLATPLGIAKAGQTKGPQQVAVPFLPGGSSFGTGPTVFDPGWSSSLGGDFGLGEGHQRQRILRQRALEHYVSSAGDFKGHVTQLQLLVDMNPLSRAGAERLDELEKSVRDALPAELRSDSKLHFIGPTASIRDLIAITGGDETRVKILVTGCVFLILLALLRRLVVSLYLVASVLFSYFTTQGVAYAVFWALQGESFSGLDWKVSILLFTVLVAIGEDYNIFLMTRIDEEQKSAGEPTAGITRALVKTGGIITSCGLIMAGTFASLLAGSLVDLKQLGFALAFGVLLDTFVVRPILVPAFLILLQKNRSKPRMEHG
jgi:RND superfamily putative drug exporter